MRRSLGRAAATLAAACAVLLLASPAPPCVLAKARRPSGGPSRRG
eukprot:CAMPEP_0194340074 /NCGR_PEP_ID=MMETSP0171-20130528/85257_1 /TAXON_ID=218684 /ORGANISM="Corethron pennatum, Strain L29A3" /LENGTH=44 /DNA_ID= /DNA_START= /DNA_END= /DNA_ORIENTATION=